MKKYSRRHTLRNSEHHDLLTEIDELEKEAYEHDTAVYALAKEMIAVLNEMAGFLEQIASVKDGVSDVSIHLGVEGWDSYDASSDLGDHASTLEDMHAQQRETARTMILLVRELLDIKD